MLGALARGLKFSAQILKGDAPKYACIQLTARCNMRCSFCHFWSEAARAADEMTLDEYRRLADELSHYGFLLTTLEGGEPFMRKDVLDIVRIFSAKHLTMLYSNGWFIDQDKAAALFAAGLHRIGISIDYPDAAAHDRKRGMMGAFDRAVRAVECLRAAAPYGRTQVNIISVLMRDNQHQIEAMLKMAKDLDVGFEINVLSQQGFHRASSDSDQLPEAPISDHLLELWEKYDNFSTFREYLAKVDAYATGKPTGECRSGSTHFNVSERGEISPCIEKVDHPFGDLRRESFSAIYKRLKTAGCADGCQSCWTLCRCLGQVISRRTNWAGWRDMMGRMQVK
jgi:radical SAM protein with 4Fe4S-binding SPASM domain